MGRPGTSLISIASFFLGLSALLFAYNMIASWRGGPRAESNPWRALTLEWQVTSPPPIFNFDAVPTVVGGPYEYGVPGAVHGVLKGGAEVPQPAGATAHGGGGGSATATKERRPLMPHILVVANQTIGGAKLLELVKERAKGPDTSFTLVVPMTKPRSGYVIYDDAVRDSAQVRLDLTLSYLRSEDVVANGELGDEDPYTATLDAIDEYHPDEIIISTLPALVLGLAAARPHRAHPGRRRRARHARRLRPRRRRAAVRRHARRRQRHRRPRRRCAPA